MSVVYAVMGHAKPGRWDDCLAEAAHVDKVFERHGVDRVRLAASTTGEPDGRWVMSLEFDSGAAYGAAMERVMADDEMQSIVSRGKLADAPAVIETSTLMVSIPVPGELTGEGAVTEVHVSRLTPGRFDDALAIAGKAFGIARRGGAVGTRMFQVVFGGPLTDLYITTFDYPSLSSQGAALDVWGKDPDAIELATGITRPNAPTTLVSSSIYTAIPL